MNHIVKPVEAPPKAAARPEVKRAQAWRAENQDAIESSNAYVEQFGLPLAQFRQF